MPDVTVIPASLIWVAPAAAEHKGSVVLGLKLVTGNDAAIVMTPEKAQEIIRLIEEVIEEVRPRKGNAPFPVVPLYPQKL